MYAEDMNRVRGHNNGGNFTVGLVWGLIVGFALALAPLLWVGVDATGELYSRLAPELHTLWAVAIESLQYSLLPFGAVLIIYFQQLYRLHCLLAEPPPDIDSVLRHEQLLGLCANLFFGIAVIWTVIGMRHALLYALGDHEAGALAMLPRLVDGGILVALSTTIVGGVGGYLMRAVKSISVGRAMNALYTRTVRQPRRENLAALGRIESA
tara:strand:- start:77307 stop:77936 length:630 start_codon:yes stop_codon:yes gene_type:complete